MERKNQQLEAEHCCQGLNKSVFGILEALLNPIVEFKKEMPLLTKL